MENTNNAGDLLDQFRKLQAQNEKQGTCPSCGYCPHCGRSARPWVIPMPYVQPYVQPYPHPYQPWYGTHTVMSQSMQNRG